MPQIMGRLIHGTEKLGIALTPEQLEQFQTYYEAMIDWNRRVNLTRITGYDAVQTRHFLDSLTVSLALSSGRDAKPRVIDIGTGAGLPGLPLKILYPDINLYLLEATTKKTDFLRHLSDKLNLSGVQILTARAEETARNPEYREEFDIVLARALAPLPVLAELALPLCRVGGRLIAQKKGTITDETAQAHYATGLMGGKLHEIKRLYLSEFSDERQLVIITKVSPTPDTYPRRPGIPAKRPLLALPGDETPE